LPTERAEPPSTESSDDRPANPAPNEQSPEQLALDDEFGVPPSLMGPPAPDQLHFQPPFQPPAQPQTLPATPAPTSPSTNAAASQAIATKTSASSAPGAPATPGAELSDAESQAFSTQEPLEYRPGMPLVGRGIRIRTAPPRLSITSRVTAGRIRNPVVLLKFNRAGKVTHADFVDGQTTGNPDWDGPIMDAVHRWTATGKALLELPESNPKATIGIQITFILRD
jgi:hypothetical protein